MGIQFSFLEFRLGDGSHFVLFNSTWRMSLQVNLMRIGPCIILIFE